jgi:hypothetical protein
LEEREETQELLVMQEMVELGGMVVKGPML